MAGQGGCLLLVVFFSGMILGAAAMFYLVKFEIVLPGFSPAPFLVGWLVIALAWLLGRVMGLGYRK